MTFSFNYPLFHLLQITSKFVLMFAAKNLRDLRNVRATDRTNRVKYFEVNYICMQPMQALPIIFSQL